MMHVPAPAAIIAHAAQPSHACMDRSATPPPGVTFEARGPQSGLLRLSLYVPPAVRRGERLVATLRLEVVHDEPLSLLSNDNPGGADYDFVVTDARTGKALAKRDDYIVMITRISYEAILRECPVYQSVTLTRAYDFPTGTFLIRATRRPTQVRQMGDRLETKRLPDIQSNVVPVTVF